MIKDLSNYFDNIYNFFLVFIAINSCGKIRIGKKSLSLFDLSNLPGANTGSYEYEGVTDIMMENNRNKKKSYFKTISYFRLGIRRNQNYRWCIKTYLSLKEGYDKQITLNPYKKSICSEIYAAYRERSYKKSDP